AKNTLSDGANYPVNDATNRRYQYDACTNAQGKATICGFDPAHVTAGINLLDLYALQPGGLSGTAYNRGATGPFTINSSSTAIQKDITLTPDTAATNEKVLLLTCQGWHREASLLTRNHVKWTMAPFGKALDYLHQATMDNVPPLTDFDTIAIGM